VKVDVVAGNRGHYAPVAPVVYDRDFRDAVADRLAAAGFPIADVPLLRSVKLTVARPSDGQLQRGLPLATYLPTCQRLWIKADHVTCAILAKAPIPSLRFLHVFNPYDGLGLWSLGGGGESVADAILANPQVQTLTLSRELAMHLATLLVGRKVLVQGGLTGPGSEGSTALVTLSGPSKPWVHHWVETEQGSSEDIRVLDETLQTLCIPHYRLAEVNNVEPRWSRVLEPRTSTLVLPGAMADLVCNELVASRCYEGLEGMVNLTVLLELLAGGGSAEVHGRLVRWLVTLGPRGLGYKPE